MNKDLMDTFTVSQSNSFSHIHVYLVQYKLNVYLSLNNKRPAYMAW